MNRAWDSTPGKYLRLAVHAARWALGYVVYALTGRTPYSAYRSMCSLFCLSSGHSAVLISRLLAVANPPRPIALAQAGPGQLASAAEVEHAAADLGASGYHVFQAGLPSALCDRLLEFALTTPCQVRPGDGEPGEGSKLAVYDRRAPVAVRYDVPTQALLDNADVRDLIADPSLIACAQSYLGSRPRLDVVSMWWHTAFSDSPDARAAQFFHFDLDRPAWVKFFFFLTDVTPDSGPHSFVAGSHRPGAIPDNLLLKGQVRLSDEEVAACFPPERILEFSVPRGTVVVEDTRGLHKGKHVSRGDRLVLQLQFSNSLFGMSYPEAKIHDPVDARLAAMLASQHDVYQAFR